VCCLSVIVLGIAQYLQYGTICSKIILLYITKSLIYIEIHYSDPCVVQCKLINTMESLHFNVCENEIYAKYGKVGLVGVRSSRNAIYARRVRRFRERRSLHNSGDRCGGLRSRGYEFRSGLRRSGRHLFRWFEDVAHNGIVARASLVFSNWSGIGGGKYKLHLCPTKWKDTRLFAEQSLLELLAVCQRTTHHNMTVCQLSYGAGMGCLRTSTSSNRK
jgi:hypothetical protein